MTTPRRLLLGLLTGVGLCFTPHASAEDSPTPVVPSDVKSAVGTTLVELLSLAEASSPTLRQFAIEIESTRGKARQAGLYPNPVASGGATQIAGPQSQYFAALSQEIVTRGKLQLSQAAVCREVAQAEFRYVQARFELLTAVRQGYFVSLAAQRRMEISNRLVEIAKKSRLAAKRAQQAGAGTLSDTLLLEIEFEKAEVTLENVETKWQASQQQLVATMGRRDFQLVRIHGDLTESLKRFESQVLIDGYVPYNAEVQSAEQDVERNRYLLQRAIVEPFPNVTIYGGYQYQVSPIQNMGLLNVFVPLPFWNKNEGNIASANAQVFKAQATVEQVQNQIAKHMADASGRFRVADQQVRRYSDRIVPKAQKAVDIIQDGFTLGELDFLRLLQTQRALVDSKLGYIDALETRWVAATELAGLTQIEAFP